VRSAGLSTCRITFVAEMDERGRIVFEESPSGLHMHYHAMNAVALLNTVAINKARYSNDDSRRAEKAREIWIRIERPSLREFLRIVGRRLLPNCPINREDVLANLE
jgi:hypothetical protein